MNKAQFIAVLMPHFNDSKKDATHAVDIVFDSVTRAVSKGDEVNIAGFGKFKKVHKKARTARNPFTGDPVKVKAKSVPRFVAGKELKEIINGDRKQEAAPKPAVAAPKKAAAKKAPKKAAKKVAKKAPKKAAKKVAKKAPKKAVKKAAKKRR
jgi:DNA-binding protein HU-beta